MKPQHFAKQIVLFVLLIVFAGSAWAEDNYNFYFQKSPPQPQTEPPKSANGDSGANSAAMETASESPASKPADSPLEVRGFQIKFSVFSPTTVNNSSDAYAWKPDSNGVYQAVPPSMAPNAGLGFGYGHFESGTLGWGAYLTYFELPNNNGTGFYKAEFDIGTTLGSHFLIKGGLNESYNSASLGNLGYQISVGYQFNRTFGIEFGYTGLASAPYGYTYVEYTGTEAALVATF